MELQRNVRYVALVAAALVWLALTLLAPHARAEGWAGAEWLYALFAPVCHQIPGRSFACFGHPLAACARCVGLYAGFLGGLLLLPELHRLRRGLLEHPRSLLLFAVPMAIDVCLPQYNTHLSRFVTGFAAAFPLGLFVWVAMEQIFHPRNNLDSSERADHEWIQAQ